MNKRYNLLLIITMLLLGMNFISVSAQGIASKRLLMWIDAEANFERFSHPDSIDYYLSKLKSLGFTDAVVDMRPITGEVLFDTPYAPKMKEWNKYVRPDFDYLGRFIATAHRLGLKVQASLNVFVAGHNYFNRGLTYSSHPEWASTVYSPSGIKSIMDEKEKYGAMVNPIDPNFRTHILNVLCDLVRRYPSLDGIMLDRVRYDGIEADFSEMSRKAFESYIHHTLHQFPEDIQTWQKDSQGQYHVKQGIYFNQWIAWRAKNIYDFMKQARKAVKAVNPKISFGTYTGAWYPSYYEVGVNFASRNYDPSKDYQWASADYKNYGYAELIDLYATGNYYTDISIADAQQNVQGVRNETDSETQRGTWYSVEGSCRHLRTILGKNKFLGGVLADQFYTHPEELTASIKMNLKESDGLMIFDICHIIHKNLWKEVADGINEAKK